LPLTTFSPFFFRTPPFSQPKIPPHRGGPAIPLAPRLSTLKITFFLNPGLKGGVKVRTSLLQRSVFSRCRFPGPPPLYFHLKLFLKVFPTIPVGSVFFCFPFPRWYWLCVQGPFGTKVKKPQHRRRVGRGCFLLAGFISPSFGSSSFSASFFAFPLVVFYLCPSSWPQRLSGVSPLSLHFWPASNLDRSPPAFPFPDLQFFPWVWVAGFPYGVFPWFFPNPGAALFFPLFLVLFFHLSSFNSVFPCVRTPGLFLFSFLMPGEFVLPRPGDARC